MAFDESKHPRVASGSSEGGQFGGGGSQTDSAEFKAWFGDSKVVDESGEPLRVFHGTLDDFNEFEQEKARDFGFHFGNIEQATSANVHGRVTREGANVKPVYLKMNNPLITEDLGTWDASNVVRHLFKQVRKQKLGTTVIDHTNLNSGGQEILEQEHATFDKLHDAARWEEDDVAWDAVESFGFDGIVYKNEGGEGEGLSYLVRHPTQIKSATGNQGTFDPENPDIRYCAEDKARLSRTRSGSAVLQIASEWNVEPSSVTEAAKLVYSRHVRDIASGERQGPYPAFYDRNILEPAAVSVAVRERYRQAAPDNPSAGWKNVGGASMYIDEDGTITAGCPGVKGEDVDELDENQDEREQRQDVAESRGIEGEEITGQQAEHLDEQPIGDVPTAENPQTVTINNQPFEVKKDKDFWFWRRPGTQAWVSASPQMIEVIEGATVAQAQGDFSINPNTQFGQAVLAVAKDYSLPPDDIADAAKHVIEGRQEFIRNREAAKQEARQLTGLTAGALAKLENAGYDHASAWKVGGVIGDRMRSFDQFAQEVGSNHPELQIGDPSDLWNILREGVQRPPQPWDPDILREAANLATASAGYEPEPQFAEPFKRSGTVEKYRRWRNVEKITRAYYGASSETDVERFWKGEIQDAIIIEDGQPMRYWRSGGSFSCEKYARTPGAGQASFAWNEDDHPRDEEGKFSEKDTRKTSDSKVDEAWSNYQDLMQKHSIEAKSFEEWKSTLYDKVNKPPKKEAPKVPKFRTLDDASTYSQEHLLTGEKNFNLDGLKPDKVHSIVQGLALVMEPLGVKIKGMHWNKRRRRASATYFYGSGGPGHIGFQKTASKESNDKRKSAYDRWVADKDKRVSVAEKRVEWARDNIDERRGERITAALSRSLENIKATKRWSVKSDDFLKDTAIHEAGHAVYHQGGIDTGTKDFGSGEPIMRSVEQQWRQELDERNAEMVDRYAVSEYAATNNAELFAEVTVAIHTDQEHVVPENVLAAYKAVMAKWQVDPKRN